jgi:hypothetical protein
MLNPYPLVEVTGTAPVIGLPSDPMAVPRHAWHDHSQRHDDVALFLPDRQRDALCLRRLSVPEMHRRPPSCRRVVRRVDARHVATM